MFDIIFWTTVFAMGTMVVVAGNIISFALVYYLIVVKDTENTEDFD